MINQLLLYNLKCFEDIKIPLKNVNVLAGLNGMGKSTVIQSLLLLKQSYIGDRLASLVLNGEYIKLGVGQDVLFEKGDEQKGITIGFNYKDFNYMFTAAYEKEKSNLQITSGEFQHLNLIPLFNKKLKYISALRIVPEDYYKVLSDDDSIGIHGENTAQILYKYGSVRIENDHVLIQGNDDENQLSLQVRKWLNLISPGVSVKTNIYASLNIAELRYEFREGTYITNDYKSSNVGFGITYTLPIILTLLLAKSDDIIIIENPEAHLHPSGQRMIGELIARASLIGAQIIVETHSDHLLNGIRLAVRKNILLKDNSNILFFHKDINSGRHIIDTPHIMQDGKLDKWPEDFFDEWDKALYEFFM